MKYSIAALLAATLGLASAEFILNDPSGNVVYTDLSTFSQFNGKFGKNQLTHMSNTAHLYLASEGRAVLHLAGISEFVRIILITHDDTNIYNH